MTEAQTKESEVGRVLEISDFNPAQKFFEDLRRETTKATFGDMARGWTENLLKRATEAGLYTPGAQ